MSVELCVILNGSLERTVEVQFTTFNSNTSRFDMADNGTDYQSLSVILTFQEEGSMCGIVQVVEDLVVENPEVFVVSIESEDAVAVVTTNVTILDSSGELPFVLSDFSREVELVPSD